MDVVSFASKSLYYKILLSYQEEVNELQIASKTLNLNYFQVSIFIEQITN